MKSALFGAAQPGDARDMTPGDATPSQRHITASRHGAGRRHTSQVGWRVGPQLVWSGRRNRAQGEPVTGRLIYS